MAEIINLKPKAAEFLKQLICEDEFLNFVHEADTIVLLIQKKNDNDQITEVHYSIKDHPQLIYALEYIKHKILENSEVICKRTTDD
ncbi:MAG: hypothetical protein KAJ19_05090 [Gammaproteobacteria bacterium]|nr:hypothetical protein [Gammaproteobacteria bacterium]